MDMEGDEELEESMDLSIEDLVFEFCGGVWVGMEEFWGYFTV